MTNLDFLNLKKQINQGMEITANEISAILELKQTYEEKMMNYLEKGNITFAIAIKNKIDELDNLLNKANKNIMNAININLDKEYHIEYA